MADEQPGSYRKKRISRKLWLLVGIGLALAVWAGHAPVLSWAARQVLTSQCAAAGLIFSAEEIVVRLDGPVVIAGVSVSSAPGSGRLTGVEVGRIAWQWNGLGSLFSDKGRLIRSAQIEGVSGAWDFSLSPWPDSGLAEDVLRWIPERLEVSVSTLDLIRDLQKLSLRGLEVELNESKAGKLAIKGVAMQSEAGTRVLSAMSAQTAWKDGTLWLAGMEVVPGVLIESLSVDLLGTGGLSLSANCFGGSLRVDVTDLDGLIDVAAWASNIPINQLAALAGVEGRAAGNLAEARLTFRGKPERLVDAEASLRLVAHGARWNERGWESLEVAASLIHRRLVVSQFQLRQKANSVGFSGELSLADGWSKIAEAPFLLNLNADIRELGALAGLLGGPLDEAGGRMTAVGSVVGRAGKVEGFLSVEASDITFRTFPPSSLRAEAIFRDSGCELVRCDVFSKKDSASLLGTISQSSPYQYAAELNARVADLAMYLAPFHAPGAESIYAGAVAAKWQGDGTAKSHSGAFDVKLDHFASGATPGGLTGSFVGTYSPQNVYLSKLRVEKGDLNLEMRATFASSGITLKDVELRSGNTPLLEGGAFLPMNIFPVVSGGDWRTAIDPGREAYVRAVSPKDLDLKALLQLAGQDLPLDGKVRVNLEAAGPASQLSAKGNLAAREILWKQAGAPPFKVETAFVAGNGTAELVGVVETKGFPPLKLAAKMPFGLGRTEADEWRWLNPAGEFSATLDFPRTDLAVFRPLLPGLHKLAGSVAGRLAFSGTVGAPRTNGTITLQNGHFEAAPRTPALTQANAQLVFDGTRLVVESFRAEVGAGELEISGGVGLADPSNPVWDVRLKGSKILLVRDAGMRLRANVDLAATGNNASGLLSGSVRLVDGRIFHRFEVTPLLLIAPEQGPDNLISAPVFSVPAPFSLWAVKVRVENETPFLICGNIAEGQIIPDLTLTGTLGSPLPIGRVTLRDVQAFLPFSTLTIPDGRIDFLPDAPWVPMLDVRGSASTPDYQIHAYAFGPLDEKKLILRSEPPLPQEALVLLLTTGIAGSTQGTGFGEAAAGQGGLFLLRSFARQLDVPGLDTDALLNRVQVQAIAPRMLGERTTMRGRFRLVNDFDLISERDGHGFFNAGVTYTWRFQ